MIQFGLKFKVGDKVRRAWMPHEVAWTIAAVDPGDEELPYQIHMAGHEGLWYAESDLVAVEARTLCRGGTPIMVPPEYGKPPVEAREPARMPDRAGGIVQRAQADSEARAAGDRLERRIRRRLAPGGYLPRCPCGGELGIRFVVAGKFVVGQWFCGGV